LKVAHLPGCDSQSIRARDGSDHGIFRHLIGPALHERCSQLGAIAIERENLNLGRDLVDLPTSLSIRFGIRPKDRIAVL
jgi:hypothetical protein